MPNQAQADSGDAWTKDAAVSALYDGGARGRWEVRPQSKDHQCQGGGSCCGSKQCALWSDHVKELAGRTLCRQSSQPADGQDSSDACRCPSVFREMDCNKGT